MTTEMARKSIVRLTGPDAPAPSSRAPEEAFVPQPAGIVESVRALAAHGRLREIGAYFFSVSRTFRSDASRISSSETSRTCVETYHACPNGSVNPPLRSP